MKKKVSKKVRIIILAAVIVAAVTMTVIGGVMFFSPKSDPEYVAHRGYSAKFPDNTEASFTGAATNPDIYGIETDIRRTKDGFLVCSHDSKAQFADGSKMVVEESSYAELIAKPLKNTKTSDDAYICTFKKYLEICKSGNKIAVVELKDVFTEDMVAQTLKEIDESYDRKNVVVIAFDYDSLYRVRLADGSIPLQYLTSQRNDPRLDECLKEGISLDIHYAALTARTVRRFHEKGLKVNVWTVDTNIVRSRMRRLKVDYITSNHYSQN